MKNATFEEFKPIVPGFFRIAISDSKESGDDRLHSFKSCVLYFFDSIDSIIISIRSILRLSVVVDCPALEGCLIVSDWFKEMLGDAIVMSSSSRISYPVFGVTLCSAVRPHCAAERPNFPGVTDSGVPILNGDVTLEMLGERRGRLTNSRGGRFTMQWMVY